MKRIIITRKLNTTIDDNGNLVTEEFDLPKIGSKLDNDLILRDISYSVANNEVLVLQIYERIKKQEPRDTSNLQILPRFKLQQ
jgi:hypothetical protein